MKAESLIISKVFASGGDILYLLPHFQREYAWEKANWQTMLDDILEIYRIYDEQREPEHFLGSLVVIADGTRSGTISAFKLIDGQQRLTTVSLFLLALSRLIKDLESYRGLYRKIRKLIINEDESGLLKYKLLPTTKNRDRDTYIALVEEQEIPSTESRIDDAFRFVYEKLHTALHDPTAPIDPNQLFLVLVNCLQVVFINLNQDEKPYQIFESLNSKGKPLTQSDLVRNYIAMRLPDADQMPLYEQYWADIERMLSENRTIARIGERTAFLRHYLAFRTGVLFNLEHIYIRFRDRMEREFRSNEAFIEELKTLHRFARHYHRVAHPDHEPEPNIRTALDRLSLLEPATSYPLMLALYERMHEGRLNTRQLTECIRIIENYFVRRYLTGEPSNYTNRMFPSLIPELSGSDVPTSLRRALARKNYPSDKRLLETLKGIELYDNRSQRRLVFILEAINRAYSDGTGGYTMLDGAATVEHIMPQTLNEGWKRYLGPDWERIHREYVHTFGNLTLVTGDWNASLSNLPFDQKRERLNQHALLMNQRYFESVGTWDEQAILQRAEHLSQIVLSVWPKLDDVFDLDQLTGRKPYAIVILGETYRVKSWRQLAVRLTDTVVDLVSDFDYIAAQFNDSLIKEPKKNYDPLKNGYYLYVKLSSKYIWTYCQKLASLAGLSSEDWEIILNPDEPDDDENENGVSA